MSDSVTTAFELMASELDAQVDLLNLEGAKLFHDSKYDEAEAQVHKGKALQKFIVDVIALKEIWQENFASSFPDEVIPDAVDNATRTILSASKSSKTGLMVRFPDGTVISELKAAETFALTLKKIGFEKVRRLGRVVNNESLISDSESPKYNDIKMGDVFVKTHSSTSSKKKMLEEISDALGCDLRVQIVS